MYGMEITAEKLENILSENEQIKAENRLLKEKIQYLLKKLFGRKSEKLDPNQLELAFLELHEMQAQLEEAEAELDSNPKPESRRGKRKPLTDRIPEDLPVEVVDIIPDEVKENPEAWKKIGQEELEELDVSPTHFFRRLIIRHKYVRIDDHTAAPVIAPAPKRLIENSYASAGLLLQIILNKYCDHLPLYRQEQIFYQRYGVELSRKTMSGWMTLMGDWFSLIYESLRQEIRSNHYIQADETFVKYQEPGKSYCPNGYLWAYHAPEVGVLFEWHASRAATCLEKMLCTYQGRLQTDGYGAYESFLNKPENADLKKGIIHSACWAHVRRKFIESQPNPLAKQMVEKIKELYKIEARLREHPELDRSAVRKKDAQPVLEEMRKLLDAEQARHLPKSNIGKAINYTLRLWDKLCVYIDYSELEIDNNLVENTIRPTAIGKKNFLFFGSPTSGQTSAIIYSLIETCRKLEINPAEYLKDVLEALPEMISNDACKYTPAQWKAHKQADLVAPTN